ncbi:uncharacterized protein LOC112345560 isoform X1 [Selaginella moellendorffii]|uniref:uncharacterized protein LOC112345560 isoform X1 n=1 Tax=Selaginella moellendorffii TaxID=88036 RepID=UPI000D1CD163|nr:uncharacterized protein LOC112345560 isoform X1 [Selaginella moellendorffii]|eukprot:XP_024528357.1 uncharacterized protein LOC112345560 isoform X1 [Selaginella moellendorffii]
MMVRNTSEEMIIRSLIDGGSTATHGAAAAIAFENMGFMPHRASSEELFNSWIANSEQGGLPPHARPSRKMSTELAALLAQQQGMDHGLYLQSEHNAKSRSQQQQEYPSLQALSWFQTSQPMTRSRSTELRRRYLEMQRQDLSSGAKPTEQSFLPWPDNLPQHDHNSSVSTVSTVVNMLKGSLEKKRVSKELQHHCQAEQHELHQQQNAVQDASFMFRLANPSESSGGNDNNSCPATPSQIHLFHDQQAGRAIIFAGNNDLQTEDQHKKQQPQLSRAGSITSSGRSGMEASDVSTKKRRVERKRMMVEAKGRSSVPAMPSDMQAAIKRSDALEKEVRSLKLNLSFMNRKDSEQTKRIEELEKQNEELLREKSRLTEELDQLISSRSTW